MHILICGILLMCVSWYIYVITSFINLQTLLMPIFMNLIYKVKFVHVVSFISCTSSIIQICLFCHRNIFRANSEVPLIQTCASSVTGQSMWRKIRNCSATRKFSCIVQGEFAVNEARHISEKRFVPSMGKRVKFYFLNFTIMKFWYYVDSSILISVSQTSTSRVARLKDDVCNNEFGYILMWFVTRIVGGSRVMMYVLRTTTL